jgi:energy-coupling factor transport system ATP-binding protein
MEEGKIILDGPPREVFRQVETLKQIGLDVPQVVELAFDLNREGFSIPGDPINIEEMVNILCR